MHLHLLDKLNKFLVEPCVALVATGFVELLQLLDILLKHLFCFFEVKVKNRCELIGFL